MKTRIVFLDWVLGSGVLAAVLLIGFLLGYFGSIWVMMEPIYCGDKPCTQSASVK